MLAVGRVGLNVAPLYPTCTGFGVYNLAFYIKVLNRLGLSSDPSLDERSLVSCPAHHPVACFSKVNRRSAAREKC